MAHVELEALKAQPEGMEHEARLKLLKRALYWADRDRQLASSAEWQRKNPERRRELNRRSHRERAEVRTALAQVQRATSAGTGFIELVSPAVVLEMQDGVCWVCGEDVDPFKFDCDHIVPLSRGGYHNYENVRADPVLTKPTTPRGSLSSTT